MSSATATMHLNSLVTDSTMTPQEKADCFKLLKVIVKNLADPTKSRDEKYRQLKLDNEKVQQKLLRYPSAMQYLQTLGFVEITNSDGEKVLLVNNVNLVTMQAALEEVTTALDDLEPATKKPRVGNNSVDVAATNNNTATTNKPAVLPEKLSEKQKARLLLEQKERLEKEQARKHRAKMSALIKQDKYVRKHDENWTSGPSAAVHKTGSSISTFRDRHGEN